jgi:hypothetical protein
VPARHGPCNRDGGTPFRMLAKVMLLLATDSLGPLLNGRVGDLLERREDQDFDFRKILLGFGCIPPILPIVPVIEEAIPFAFLPSATDAGA